MYNISFRSISDSRIPIAITDLNFTLQYGNKSLYTLIGNELFFSIYKVVHPDDRARLTECLQKITVDNTFTDVFAILYSDNEYHHMLLNFNYIPSNHLIRIEFQYLSDIINEHSNLDYEIKKYRALFTLDGDNIFEYDPETNHFKFYWINDTQNIMLYNGDFNIWKQNTLKNNLIANTDVSIFTDLCNAIENSNTSFEYQLNSSILTNGDIYECTKVKGRTIINNHGKTIVLGVWLLYNTIYNFKENHFIDSLYKDELTGLLNKREITQYVTNTLNNKPDYPIHMFILDLDNFKQCNDTYGHMFGDEIIKSVALIIKNTIQQNGVAGRIGGDEFLVVLENMETENLLRNILRSIRANIQWLYREKLSSCQLSCSIGVSSYPKDSSDYDTLFKIADYSLYLAKRKGKGRYIIYDYNLHGPVTCNANDGSIFANGLPTNSVTTLTELKKSISSVYSNGRSHVPELFESLKGFCNLHNIAFYIPNKVADNSEVDNEIIYCVPSLFEAAYINQFTETESFCVTNIKNLEFTFQQIYDFFAEKSSTSFYQCLLTDSSGALAGIISYERSTVHNSWTNDIKHTLNLVSAILGNIIFDY